MQYQNPDIDEMFGKLRKIRCMWCPRFSMYDKVSKTQIYLDTDIEHMGKANHIAWKARSGAGMLGEMLPMADFKSGFKPMKEALDIALTIARNNELETYKLEPYMRENEWHPGKFVPDYKIKEV